MAKYNDPPKKNALAKAAEYKPSSTFNKAVKQSVFKKLPQSFSKGYSSKVEGGTGGRPETPLPATSFKAQKKAIKQKAKLAKLQAKADMTPAQKQAKRKNIGKNIMSGLGAAVTASQTYSTVKKNLKN
jgi:hypothetical protein